MLCIAPFVLFGRDALCRRFPKRELLCSGELLLTTVGIDRSYYAPIPLDDFRRYADQLPDGFRCCIKAPSTFTSYALGTTGTPVLNQDFLSHWRLIDDLLEPCEIAFKSHTGPIVIECPPVPRGVRLDPAEFAARLDQCLTELPHDYTYAIELRDRALLEFLYATGARISEACWLSLHDLDRDERVVRLFGKGSKERVVPFGRSAAAPPR